MLQRRTSPLRSVTEKGVRPSCPTLRTALMGLPLPSRVQSASVSPSEVCVGRPSTSLTGTSRPDSRFPVAVCDSDRLSPCRVVGVGWYADGPLEHLDVVRLGVAAAELHAVRAWLRVVTITEASSND